MAHDPHDNRDAETPDKEIGKPQEKVEDRPGVGQVTPEDYARDLPDH